MEAARGQKHPSDAENGMKESIYWKKCLMKVAQQPQKLLNESNQIWDTTSDKKDTPQQPPLGPQSVHKAPKKHAKRDS